MLFRDVLFLLCQKDGYCSSRPSGLGQRLPWTSVIRLLKAFPESLKCAIEPPLAARGLGKHAFSEAHCHPKHLTRVLLAGRKKENEHRVGTRSVP